MQHIATIPVHGPSPYEVVIGHALLPKIVDCVQRLNAARIAIVHQPPLAQAAVELAEHLSEAGIQPHTLAIPDAEESKSLKVLGELWDELGNRGFDRRDAIIGLGGGATTDLAGFLAATWMRGIRVIQVPTTVLAMVDAAVGGKTGINTAYGKNLVGAFHEPSAVFIDMDFARSLPKEEIAAGSAEIIKTGFISDTTILERWESDPASCLDIDGTLPQLVVRSVAVKAKVVGEDLKEAGLREILNYGHTFGHAVERCENYQWRHGCAVSVGMMYVAYVSEITGLIDSALVDRHADILKSAGLPTSYQGASFADLYDAMQRDKKNRDGILRFVALDGQAGVTTRLEGPTNEQLRAAYEMIVSR